MAIDVTNALLDARLAAVVAAEDGPWTRTGTLTDLDTIPYSRPNSDTQYHVKTASGHDVYISYDELADVLVRLGALREGLGVLAIFNDLKKLVTYLSTALANVPAFTATEEQYTQVFGAIQASRFLAAIIPYDAWVEIQPNGSPVDAVFSLGAPSGNDVVVTDTSVGLETWRLWDFGDGVTSQREDTPFTYTFPGAGTYDVTLTIIGPYGSDQHTEQVTII